MGELDADCLAIGLIILGGALQHSLGGPWLLVTGALAVGPRLAFTRDDRRAVAFTVAAGLVWIVLHWVLGRDLSRLQVAAEVLGFLAFVAVFWAVRASTREPEGGADAEVDKESVADLEVRLERLREEAAAMLSEREGWAGLFGIMKGLGEALRLENLVEVITTATREHLRMPAYALLLDEQGAVRVRAQLGADDAAMTEAVFKPGRESLAGWLLAQRDPVLVDDVRDDPRFPGALLPYRALVALPLRLGAGPAAGGRGTGESASSGGSAIAGRADAGIPPPAAAGVLVALDREPRTFTRNDFQRAGILSKQLALGLGKTLLYEQVEQLSITDGLTGLYRHRYFQERLEGELERARRYQRPLSLVMADLDNFKAYNDRFGHLEGDDLLRLAGRVLTRQFRRQAIVARYGGEEFAVLLPDTTREQAVEETDRARAAIGAESGATARESVTCSAGVATFPLDARSRRDLIARADAALYQAKREGKNRVCAAAPPA